MELLTGVFGNQKIRRQIGADILEGTLPHALLIDGPAGSGKMTLAKEIAAALLCEHRGIEGEPLPCRRCEACRKVFENLCPDVTVLGKNGKAGIGIDPVRELRSDMFLSPTEAEEKIYIVEDAHALTPQAQNALLVVLEEPPRNVRIILLAEETDSLLITVKSRVRRYTTCRLTPRELDEYVPAHSAEGARLKEQDPHRYAALLQGANGAIGTFLSMLDPTESEALMATREIVDGLLSCLSPSSDYGAICSAVAALSSTRGEITEELLLFQGAIRDLLLLRDWSGVPLCYYTDREIALAHAEKISRKRACKVADGVCELLAQLERNGNLTILQARLRSLLKNS